MASKAESNGAAEVDAHIDKLKHPLKPVLAKLRQLILSVSKEFSEGIKWNAPSFRTKEWFATCNVRGRDKLLLILHLGAKPHPAAKAGLAIADPKGLLRWLGKDRAMIAFEGEAEFEARSEALRSVIRQWISHL
jgi:hypothetical protein